MNPVLGLNLSVSGLAMKLGCVTLIKSSTEEVVLRLECLSNICSCVVT